MLKESYKKINSLVSLKEETSEFKNPLQLAKVSKYLIDNNVDIYKESPGKFIMIQGNKNSSLAGKTFTIKILPQAIDTNDMALVVKFEGTTKEPIEFLTMARFEMWLKKHLIIK